MDILEEIQLGQSQLDIVHRLIRVIQQNPDPHVKEQVFKYLQQVFHPLISKMSKLMFQDNRLVDKELPGQHRFFKRGIFNESYTEVLGIFWEVILDFDPDRGVYFPYFLKKKFEWRLKNTLKKDRRKQRKYRDDKMTVQEVSYEKYCEGLQDDLSDEEFSIAPIVTMVYDDNFDLMTFDWSLDEPSQFVETPDLYRLLSSFTPKQTEAFVMELQGYYQEQIAGEITAKTGKDITQQAVNERLENAYKKIAKFNQKRIVKEIPESKKA